MDRYDKEIYNRAIDDVVDLISRIEDNYRHKMYDNDCMQDDPFSDGILSAVFTIVKAVKRLKEN